MSRAWQSIPRNGGHGTSSHIPRRAVTIARFRVMNRVRGNRMDPPRRIDKMENLPNYQSDIRNILAGIQMMLQEMREDRKRGDERFEDFCRQAAEDRKGAEEGRRDIRRFIRRSGRSAWTFASLFGRSGKHRRPRPCSFAESRAHWSRWEMGASADTGMAGGTVAAES